MKRLVVTACAAGVIAASNVGCGEHDVKIDGADSAPAARINFPNHFSTVAHKCDGHGHRIYENDHGDSGKGGGAIFVIPDASCPGGVPEPGR